MSSKNSSEILTTDYLLQKKKYWNTYKSFYGM